MIKEWFISLNIDKESLRFSCFIREASKTKASSSYRFFLFPVFAFFLLFASLSVFIYKKKKKTFYRISFNSNNVNGQTFMYTQTKMFSFPNTIRKGILGNCLFIDFFFFIYVPCLFWKLAITAFHKFLSFTHHRNVPLFYYPVYSSGRVGRGGEGDFFSVGVDAAVIVPVP